MNVYENHQENSSEFRQDRQNLVAHAHRRRSSDSQHMPTEEPVIFGVLVIQICICIFIIAAAFILRGMGGSTYESVRQTYLGLVSSVEAMANFTTPTETVGDYQDKMNQLEEKLSQIPEEYTTHQISPQEDEEETGESQTTSSDENSEVNTNDEDSVSQSSGKGGEYDVSYVANAVETPGNQDRWAAPEGTSLSPFFMTAVPIAPVDGTITSPYGYRIHPITGNLDFHNGLDIAAPKNTPIRAILPGTVTETGESEIYGNYIVVTHQNGLESIYNHCESITAKTGTVVRQGDWIAKVGSTGLSTGNHVHLDIKINGVYVNPYLAYTGVQYAELSDL